MTDPTPTTPPLMRECRHCHRPVTEIGGRWIDPDASGDDAIWREACSDHGTFTAEHEPVEETSDYDPSRSLSYSSMSLHRQCPQAWAYRYLRGLTTASGSVGARDLGSWWHAVRAFDAIRVGLDLGSLRSAPVEIGTGDNGPTCYRVGADPDGQIPLPAAGSLYRIGENGSTISPSSTIGLDLAAAYWKRLGGEERDQWVEEIGDTLPDRLAYMDARWRERWAAENGDEAPLGVEVKVRRAIPGTDATMPGYVDLVYLDTRRNLTVVRDYKTSRTLQAADAEDDLSDSQLHLYAWALEEQARAWEVPPVTAISYDRARTAKPKQPGVTATSGTLSKSVTDYDLHTYLSWAAGPDGEGVPWGTEGEYVKSGKRAGEPKFGRYVSEEQVVERLSSPAAASVWHQRSLTPLNRNIVAAHLRSIGHTQPEAARTVETFRETGEAPRNFHRRLCGWCDFAKLCRAELLGGADGDYPVEQFGLTLKYPNK